MHTGCSLCTDKKEKKIFLIYKEIQNGAVAKSYMTILYNCSTLNFLIYMKKFDFLFLSVWLLFWG